MATAFVRQLGAESGIQLNPLKDNSGIPATSNSDQIFGIIMRATRGRIDRPFEVDASNVYKKLGKGEQIRINALNEAWVHVVEALSNGAYSCVVQRLTTAKAKIKYLICRVTKTEAADGAAATQKYTFEVAEELPKDGFFFALKHLECHNDGIKVEIHAEEENEGGKDVDQKVFALKVIDADENTLYSFEGSVDVDAKDDFGNSAYLPDVISKQTDNIELTFGADAGAFIPESDAYGYDENGQQKWVESPILACFDEGGFAYETADYVRARKALQNATFDFAYVSSGGTQSPALLGQLSQLCYDTNKQCRFDIPGGLTPEAAINFVRQLNFGASKTAHLMQAFWSPLKSDDPTGVNPAGYFGTATLNIAYACARNAEKNAKGFAPKNYPIAGVNWPIQRTNIVQTYTCEQSELNQLAKAKINPVRYETYSAGGKYVFFDSITCAQVDSSLRKLIAVADMSTSIDDFVCRTVKEFLQLPMSVAIKKTEDFLKTLFEGAEASGWLVPSSDPQMGGAAWRFTVAANEQRPYDTIDVNYWLRYDGTARQIFITQTLTK